MKVLIIGASPRKDRYSNMAMHALLGKKHETVLFNPLYTEIDGCPVVNSLASVSGKIDTVTLYTGPKHLIPLIDDIIALKPGRIISNPGTECEEMRNRAESAGIEYLEACTLVLLSIGQFEK